MKTRQMVSEIEERRTGVVTVIAKIEQEFTSIIDKVIASVYYLSSQVYGRLIKDYIKNYLKADDAVYADGKTNAYGYYKVKVFVGCGNSIDLKQVTPGENVKTYVCVAFDYSAATVKIYAIPSEVVWDATFYRPSHGTVAKGVINEYTSHILAADIEEYIIEEGTR